MVYFLEDLIMANSFFGAVTKGGGVFVETSQRKIGKETKKKNIAGHNVLVFKCQQGGNDGEIKMKRLPNRKVRFKPDSVQIETLKDACKQFVIS